MITVPVPLGAQRYDVHIGINTPEGAADTLAAALGSTTGTAVLVDERLARNSPRVAPLVAALEARLRNVRQYDLPAGESCKTLAAINDTCQWLAENGFDRGASIIAIGGGATCDHGGFAAAIYLRGIPFASCPTTLLAMVDASVGGKTGVDLPAGKNLIGSFHQPRAVIADLGFFDTLPPREIAAGMAEVVKAGLTGDRALYERIEREAVPGAKWTRDQLEEIIAAAVRFKVDVVMSDEREANRRAVLNFGHTVGHAIEAASGYDLLHGEAVSLGMIAALALGIARGVTPPELLPRTSAVLQRLGLPVDVKQRITPEVLTRIEVDKKRRSDRVRFVLCPRLGEATLQDIPLDELKRQVTAALG